ncbi:MAG TPA: dicarboxylate/amino acid:cation symporter [Saprospiraceae bacterium]|nr:dicarboxylate/amino acid:cation symporter [Saprospiraceae bacterium]
MALHWKILLGILLGLVFGIIASFFEAQSFVIDWIKPLGTIFINLLKLIAIPLILVSLIKGLVDLQDISKFKVMGIRTFLVYVSTTIIAVSIGLLMVNIIMPGDSVSPDTIAQLTGQAESDMKVKIDNAATSTTSGPLQFLVDMVPDNFFKAASGNSNMLQVIFFAIFFGISLLLVDKKVGQPVIDFFNGLNEVIMKMVDLIMLMAPYAVFALLSALIVEITNPDLFIALIWYMVTVLLGLILMILFYALVVYLYVKKSPLEFYKAIAPAQLLAFSTSSSAATLPVTMERVEEHLGVDKEVSSFVCPLGATINMDGTSLYQAVAAVFICEALNFELTFAAQLTIILTATLASIGSAAVPGAGLIMLVVVLESLDLPAESMAIGLALIFAVDRPLDMCRTIVNITGDCMVALVIGKSLNKIHTPKPKEWNDNYAA